METTKFRKFASFARRSLREQVSSKLSVVLAKDSAARRENSKAVNTLEEAIASYVKDGKNIKYAKDQIIEQVAYTWFNRFCALRFMDVNDYNRVNIVSPADPGQFQPEILAEAKMGHIDQTMVSEKRRQQIFALLDGKAPSRDPQGEAYRLLLVAACNFWNEAMPFLFQRIDDYSELLMPDDLLSGKSILAYTREAMTPKVSKDVEVIGWLYQFYISEKKDDVFVEMKKEKIKPENIPAATQLFTPHWIVRYLVENSLGRLWLLNRPNSKLIEQMDYYIKPEQAETVFLRIKSPEDIKICDPACGSGHMLTYAFDLLYAIYEEEGYEPTEIPQKILAHNLYGIEIDERAGELAAFALTMKARAKQRRFFSKGVKPNICVLENVHFDEAELKDYMDAVGRDLFTTPLQTTLRQFEEAKNFGSLIRPEVTDVDGMLSILASKDVSEQLFLSMTHQKVLKALRQADYLSPKYHVVVANPPYMGSKGMNPRLGGWLKDNYPDVKSDLFSAFIVRNTELTIPRGQLGFMTPFVWMFISSYEKLRNFLINKKTITSLVQLEYSGFDGATVPICTFTVENAHHPDFRGGYIRLSDFRGSENQGPRAKEAIENPDCEWFYRASAADFKKIPGSPMSYWLSDSIRNNFLSKKSLGKSFSVVVGLQTSDNERFVRFWHEVDSLKFSHPSYSPMIGGKWYAFNKGGEYRKWYGNAEYVVNWEDDGREIKSFKDSSGKLKSRPQNINFYFKPHVGWSKISSGKFNVRVFPKNFIFADAGISVFSDKKGEEKYLSACLNSTVVTTILKGISPTLNFEAGDVSKIPIYLQVGDVPLRVVSTLIGKSKLDWDSFETSWDFTGLPLLLSDYCQLTLEETYQKVRAHWREMTLEMQRLEGENNRIFIDAYGLQDELTPDVPLSEITLTCNPHYRYSSNKSEDELEALLLADTMRELISYAVGCMFGRYALDKPGLILANQGETIEDYLKQIPEPSFPADDNNVIPMLDGDWFTDDITERFRKFLRVAFGEEHYEANLNFVEKAIGKDIRKYFLRDFYNDHVKRYKKRPIYWLFSSSNGSFNALIYLHRYRPDTVSVVLNDYLREFRDKLSKHKQRIEAASISASSSQREKTQALKEIDTVNKMIAELEAYERDALYPLATEQIEIDLDDGVKVNYPKLSAALKKVAGLN